MAKYNLNDRDVRDAADRPPFIPATVGETLYSVDSVSHFTDSNDRTWTAVGLTAQEANQDKVAQGNRYRLMLEWPTGPRNKAVRLRILASFVCAAMDKRPSDAEFDIEEGHETLCGESDDGTIDRKLWINVVKLTGADHPKGPFPEFQFLAAA